MSAFTFKPSPVVPFGDVAQIKRCRAIKREDITKHANADFQIRVVKDADFELIWVSDMFARIKLASDEGRPCVMVLPNPAPSYRHVARLINNLRVDCKHLHVFAMDEYADENGNIAPESWRFGFMHALTNYFYENIDENLRPLRNQFHAPNNQNINDYGKMIADLGGAEICYTGPGWTGHMAFVEPDAPEFGWPDVTLEQWKQMGTRICTLSPFTLAQNSMHGSFGKSGDLSAVPPKCATIGPADVIAAKHRWEMAALGVHGTTTSWQRMIARLCYHGPVTPKLPSSLHQQLRTDCYISETIAADIQPDWEKGY